MLNFANLTLNSDVDQDTLMFGSHESSLCHNNVGLLMLKL